MSSKMPIAQLKSTDPGTSSWYQTRLKRKTHKLTTSDTHTHTHKHTMNKIKIADKASISNTEVKSAEIGLKETESNKALPAIGSVIDHRVFIYFKAKLNRWTHLLRT